MTDRFYSIGVDLGATNLRLAAYSQSSGFLETITLRTRLSSGRDAVMADLCQAARKLLAGRLDSTLVAIGIGSPGPLELPAGRIRNPPNLPGWDGFELRPALERSLQVPVIPESDGNVAALAECLVGKGRTLGLDSLCMLTLGTGVGNGIVLNGKIWHGMNGMAGEAGHATIWPDGHDCGCGSRGCLEQYASATAVRRMAREAIAAGRAPGLAALEREHPDFTATEVSQLAASGDAGAKEIFHVAGRSLGIALAALVNTLNLPLYVVGGGLARSWSLFSPALFEELRHRSYVYRLTAAGQIDSEGHRSSQTHIEPAELGPDAGLLGACLLPFNQLQPGS